MFAGLNALCANVFGEAVDYLSSTDPLETYVGISGIPELDSEEEQRTDSKYLRMFFDATAMSRKPTQGDVVSVPDDASPFNLMGEPRVLPLGSSWTVFETLVDPVGGASVRLRRN